MKIAHGQSILFTGDSITDCGRSRPIGSAEGLGDGYVSFIDSLLKASYPERRITIFNSGISANRVTDLQQRWQKDVLDLKPHWLSVMIGINDVWRQFKHASDPDQVEIELYESTYRDILRQARPALTGIILMTPYLIEPNMSDPIRKCMDSYGQVVKRLANDFNAIFVNVQEAFDSYLSHQPPQSLCSDRVHPNKAGHMIIARTFLESIEFK